VQLAAIRAHQNARADAAVKHIAPCALSYTGKPVCAANAPTSPSLVLSVCYVNSRLRAQAPPVEQRCRIKLAHFLHVQACIEVRRTIMGSHKGHFHATRVRLSALAGLPRWRLPLCSFGARGGPSGTRLCVCDIPEEHQGACACQILWEHPVSILSEDARSTSI
jgi:hypothetical protein